MLSPILACSSVPSAIEFYTQKLGFQLAWSMPPNEKGETEFAAVKLADAEIMLGVTEGFVKAADMDKRGTGIQIYINLPATVPIDTIYATAQANGVVIRQALQVRDWGERVFVINDLDGYNLMFAQQAPKTD
jgi:uncharacterized glyoxalase superfamily protein PhnB